MDQRGVVVLLAAALLLICSLRFLRDVLLRRLDLFDVRHWFLAYFFLEYGAWPIHLAVYGRPRLLQALDLDEVIFTEAFAILAATLFQIGCLVMDLYLGRRHRVSEIHKITPELEATNDRARVVLAVGAGICFALALIAIIHLLSKTPGLAYYLTHINEQRLTVLADYTFSRYLINLSLVGAICILGLFGKTRPIIAIAAVAIAIVLNGFFAHRAVAAIVLVMALGFYWYGETKLKPSSVFLIVFGFLALNVFYVSYRSATDTSAVGKVDVGSSLGNNFLSRYHGVESLIAVWKGQREGIDGVPSYHLLTDPWQPVLRVVAASRAGYTAEDAFNKRYVWWYQHGYGGKAGGFAITVLAELTLLVGKAGALVAMTLLGVGATAVYAAAMRRRRQIGWLFGYLLFLSYFVLMNETISVSIAKFGSLVLPLIALFWLARMSCTGWPKAF